MTRADIAAARQEFSKKVHACGTDIYPDRAISTGIGSLAPRQLQAAKLIASGKSHKQAAAEMFIGVETVKLHLSIVYRKLGIGGQGARRELELRRKEWGL